MENRVDFHYILFLLSDLARKNPAFLQANTAFYLYKNTARKTDFGPSTDNDINCMACCPVIRDNQNYRSEQCGGDCSCIVYLYFAVGYAGYRGF